MHTIYLITNKINNKIYVGQTHTTSVERWKEHVWSVNKPDYFHNAIRKYGKTAFSIEDLAYTETLEEAKKTEMFYILLLKSYVKGVGYNSTLGGESGEIPTEEIRRKIGDASASRTHSEETRQKMSKAHSGENNHFFGKSHTPETIEKIRETCKRIGSGENNYWFGKTLSPEHRAKISASKRKSKEVLNEPVRRT